MEPTVVAQLVIALTAEGQVLVNGPLDNKLLALGMLECAKDAVLKHCDAAEKRAVILAPAGLAPALKFAKPS